MDKYEFRVSLDEIDRLIEERRFGEAAAIADKIDWEKVRGTFTLCKISDLYKINKRYKDSRDLLEIAYERKPGSRKIIYSLCELELKLNNYIHALQLYNAFINVAPRDPDRFLLQYKLYKKQDVNVFEQISVLEEFLRRDFREKYAYELATLYLKAGDEQRCASQCDEIVAYFGDGRFVIRALELKKSIMPLTPQQEEHLEILLSGGKYVPPSSANEDDASAETDGETAVETGGESAAENGTADREETAPESGKTGAGEAEGKASAQNTASMQETNPYSVQRTAAAAEAAARTDRSRAETEQTEQESQQEQNTQDDRDGRDDSEQTGNPEEYTDTLLSDVKMQETIARGMREIDDDYDSVLAQETSGQLAMVMEEEPQEETQTEGQLNLEQIMSEWEKIRRNSEQQRLAEARRRVMERSDAVKRELYGDDFSEETGETGESVETDDSGTEAEGDAQSGTTRSWDSEDVKRRMKK